MAKRNITKLKKETRVMRISADNYDEFGRLKDQYALKNNLKACTYDLFLEQLLSIASLIMQGQEVYRVSNKAFDDIADARGEAILQGIRDKTPPSMPEVLIRVGTDDGFGSKHAST